MLISDVKDVLSVCNEANETLLISGKHGIGKSQSVQQYCKENGLHLEELFLSSQETGDLIGMPIVVGKEMHYTKPEWLVRMEKNAEEGIQSVLFLDELNRAPLDVRQSSLQLVLEKKIHEHTLPTVDGKPTMIVAAINPSDEYQVDELDPALLDRFLTIDVETDSESWLKWARSKNVNKIVTSFITDNQEFLHYPEANEQDEKYPTPRAWAKLSDIMDAIPDTKFPHLMTMINGKIGGSIGRRFYDYAINFSDQLTYDDIIKFIDNQKYDTLGELGEKVESLIGDKEAIYQQEMAQTIIEKNITKNSTQESAKYALGMLYGLKLEVRASILKTMKKDDKERFAVILKIDSNKDLIRSITDYIIGK